MKREGRRGTASIGFVGVGLAVALAAAAACDSGARQAEAKAQILRTDAEWLQAAQARDVDRAVSYWSDDAVVLPPGGPALVGKAALREYVVKSFQTPGFTISWKTTDVTVAGSGDLAYAIGANRVTFTGPAGSDVVIEGKAVTAWRRDAAGTWKCTVDTWNESTPPPQ